VAGECEELESRNSVHRRSLERGWADISQASLVVGARQDHGSRDFNIALANGQNNDSTYFGIGYTTPTDGFVVPHRDLLRGQTYTVTVWHQETGLPGYADDNVEVLLTASTMPTSPPTPTTTAPASMDLRR
jgi:hypothetical protein